MVFYIKVDRCSNCPCAEQESCTGAFCYGGGVSPCENLMKIASGRIHPDCVHNNEKREVFSLEEITKAGAEAYDEIPNIDDDVSDFYNRLLSKLKMEGEKND